MLAPGGRLNIFAGIYPKDQLHIDPNLIHYGEWVITGSADSAPVDFNHALEMIESGLVNTETLISHLIPLEDLGKGFEIVKSLQGLKIKLDVNAFWHPNPAPTVTPPLNPDGLKRTPVTGKLPCINAWKLYQNSQIS